MAIVTSYSVFRHLFAAPGAPLALDGLPEWPYATHVRANSIPEIECVQIFSPPQILGLTINDGALDSVPGVHEFDWYVTQRTTDSTWFSFALGMYDLVGDDTASGSIHFTITGWADKIYPEPFDADIVPLLWRDIWAYCRRRSDGAIQVLDVGKCVMENLAVTGG
jgi:hypothetical protein